MLYPLGMNNIESIISFYRNLIKLFYKIFFVTGILVIPAVVIYFFVFFTKNNIIFSYEDKDTKINRYWILEENGYLIWNLIYYWEIGYFLGNLKNEILRWVIDIKKKQLYYVMAKNKDIIFPYSFQFSWDFEYYSYLWNKQFYDKYFSIIFSSISGNKLENLYKFNKKAKKIESVIDYFNLSCIKISQSQPFCKENILYFVKNAPKYNIYSAKDIEEVLDTLLAGEYKSQVCKTLINYVYNYNDIGNKIVDTYITYCPKEKEIYTKLKIFNKIIQSIRNWVFDDSIVLDKDLLMFKVISYQRYIYLYWIDKNLKNIDKYFSLVENILDSDVDWQPIFDVIFYFNNFVLKDLFKDYALVPWIGNKIKEFNYKIKYFNRQYTNYSRRLYNLVSMDLLQEYQDLINKQDILVVDYNRIYTIKDKFLKFIENYPSYEVIDILYDEKTKVLKAKLKITTKDPQWKISKQNIFGFVLKNDGDLFYIVDVYYSQDDNILEYAKRFVYSKNRVDFNSFLEWFKFFNWPSKDIDFCDYMTNTLSNNKVNIEKCDFKKVVFTINQWWKSYKFGILLSWVDIAKFVSYDVSRDLILEKINLENYQGQRWVISLINDLSKLDLSMSIKKVDYIPDIVNLFKELLDTDVIVKENKVWKSYKVSFQLEGINFEWTLFYKSPYDMKLFSLFIVLDNNKKIRLKWLRITLNQSNILNLNKFKNQPLEFIKEVDPQAVEEYEKLIKNR